MQPRGSIAVCLGALLPASHKLERDVRHLRHLSLALPASICNLTLTAQLSHSQLQVETGMYNTAECWCAACRVAPVYRHIFPLSTAPTLSIIGLPWKVVPFPEFELQAKWIARVLSKRVSLPSQEDMQAEVHDFYSDLKQQGVPARLVPLALCAGDSRLCDWPLGVHTFASFVNALGIAIVVCDYASVLHQAQNYLCSYCRQTLLSLISQTISGLVTMQQQHMHFAM